MTDHFKRVSNPPHRWKQNYYEWVEEPRLDNLEIYEETVKNILSENDSPDLGFKYSLNPYRGCQHACAYCYARPSHQYWDFGAGTDFERKIIVKKNAPEKLEETLAGRKWQGDVIVFSGNTDCYQPLEGRYELTRKCLEICLKYRNPVGIITKSALIQRDADILGELSKQAGCTVFVSIPFFDEKMARAVEPFASSPAMRFKTLQVLSEKGIETGVGFAPIIPGLNEDQIPKVLKEARKNGATMAFRTLLRLPAELRTIFFEKLREQFPDRVNRVLHNIQHVREGKIYQSGFHERMQGSGEKWKVIDQLFELTCRKLGLNDPKTERNALRENTYRRPQEPDLFQWAQEKENPAS
jgi:DNA repair photolyase